MDAFRHFIIKTAEVLMVIVVGLITLWFAVAGAGYAQVMGGGAYWILGLIVGAAAGFVFAAILAAYFFLLLEIAENTRRA